MSAKLEEEIEEALKYCDSTGAPMCACCMPLRKAQDELGRLADLAIANYSLHEETVKALQYVTADRDKLAAEVARYRAQVATYSARLHALHVDMVSNEIHV